MPQRNNRTGIKVVENWSEKGNFSVYACRAIAMQPGVTRAETPAKGSPAGMLGLEMIRRPTRCKKLTITNH
jgi:hypothetical protein